MKCIIAPDKFKGSLTALEASRAMEAGIREIMPHAEILAFPMADGGDGFAAVMGGYLQPEHISCPSQDAIGRPCMAGYGLIPGNHTAIIEVATASGLAQLAPHEYDALHASTYGTGLLIQHAMDRGASSILLGLGGSATTDMGMGILQALGFVFADDNGGILTACGASLSQICSVNIPHPFPQVKFIMACDVFNPLCGPNGAAFVYAPQKGADTTMVKQLDEGLDHANRIFGNYSGKDFSILPGSGAAGGIAAGLAHFFEVDIQSGFDLVLQESGMEKELSGAAWLLTGEGRFDAQSFEGKVTGKLIELAKKHEVKCAVFCGVSHVETMRESISGLDFLSSLVQHDCDENKAKEFAFQCLKDRVSSFTQQWAAGLI